MTERTLLTANDLQTLLEGMAIPIPEDGGDEIVLDLEDLDEQQRAKLRDELLRISHLSEGDR